MSTIADLSGPESTELFEAEYEIDFTKIKTTQDVVRVLAAMGVKFTVNTVVSHDIFDIVKPVGDQPTPKRKYH